jgi:hypothetical protein
MPFQPIKSFGLGGTCICTIQGEVASKQQSSTTVRIVMTLPHTPAISHNGPHSCSIFSLSVSSDPLGDYDI